MTTGDVRQLPRFANILLGHSTEKYLAELYQLNKGC